MSRGHPKYKPEFCEMLIDHMSRGYSYDSFAADAKVHRRALYQWEELHPEWADAKEVGQAKRLKYYEKLLILKTSGQSVKGFNEKHCDTYLLALVLRTIAPSLYNERMIIDFNVNGPVTKISYEDYIRQKIEEQQTQKRLLTDGTIEAESKTLPDKEDE